MCRRKSANSSVMFDWNVKNIRNRHAESVAVEAKAALQNQPMLLELQAHHNLNISCLGRTCMSPMVIQTQPNHKKQ
eukprot:1100807-Amphidinium_carterae.1